VGLVRYLLDTCAFLWLAQQPDMISPRAAVAINDASNDLFLSDVSILEIVLKHSAGKLPLPGAPRTETVEET
jgi:PIN domain nuclease of toxin-antitoxin system